MRKGRSQRKARASLPPLSVRMAAANAGVGPATSRSPSVVIGITETPPPVSEVTESEETRESLANEPPLETEARPSRPARTSRPSLSPESVRALSIEPPPVSVPEADPFSQEPEPPEQEEDDEPSSMRAIVTPDEMSIPPVGDLVVEPMAERFFSEGDLAHSLHPEESAETWDNPDKIQRKSEPHVVERRARFSKYVTWAVGGAAIVCLAALIRTTTTRGAAPAAPKPVVAAAVVVAEPAPEPPAPAAKAAEAAVTVSTPKVEVPAPPEAAEPAAAAPAPAPTGDAKAEKNDCRRNLERGKLADAIAAGERAVALDTEDGEAWLLLGASYQEKGNAGEARRAYTSCVKEGKRGPVGECRQMLR